MLGVTSMSQTYTRRQLLKIIAAAAATATFAPPLHARTRYPTTQLAPDSQDVNSWVLQGRAVHAVTVYEEASASAKRLTTVGRDEAVEILEEVRAPFSAHNDLWYRTPLGYVHSAWVLPMRIYPPQPFIEDVGKWGFWGEISQVYTDAKTAPSLNAGRKYRFYGSTVFHVIDAILDEAGTGWYKVADDYPPKVLGLHQWVLARDVRRVPRAEMAPIRPFAGNKRMEMDLATQTLTCFEGETPVFSTRTASGVGGDLATPSGNFCVLLKQATRHMANMPYEGMPEPLPAPEDYFDLPGVPWNTFFDLEGRAIHGAYWHNDYGIRRSHGCINVPVASAQFIYRWTHPVGGFEDEFIRSNCKVGTPLIIR